MSVCVCIYVRVCAISVQHQQHLRSTHVCLCAATTSVQACVLHACACTDMRVQEVCNSSSTCRAHMCFCVMAQRVCKAARCVCAYMYVCAISVQQQQHLQSSHVCLWAPTISVQGCVLHACACMGMCVQEVCNSSSTCRAHTCVRVLPKRVCKAAYCTYVCACACMCMHVQEVCNTSSTCVHACLPTSA